MNSEMVKSMNQDPVFALSNPDPEILPSNALKAVELNNSGSLPYCSKSIT